MIEFKDKFSHHASDYANYRPEYPKSLAHYLSSQTQNHDIAVDIACGSGQLTKSLSGYFAKIYGFDASPQQISQIKSQDDIIYAVAQAESLPLADNSVDLITIAQALHWFDIDAFWQEATRIGKQNSIVAAICYSLCEVSDEVDEVILPFYESLREYWAAERALIESAYSTLSFPFVELQADSFTMRHHWTGYEFLSYISTWSAVKLSQESGNVPMDSLKKSLQSVWDFAECKEVIFLLHLRLGRII